MTDKESGSSGDAEKRLALGPRAVVKSAWYNASGEQKMAAAGLNLMKQSDCFNCHAVAGKLVGPSFISVADRYRDIQKESKANVAERIIKGSSGVWGPLPMLPHPNLTNDQVIKMTEWIFDLQPGDTSDEVKGFEGSFKASDDPAIQRAVLEAVFTDTGHNEAGALATTASVTLRPRKVDRSRRQAC